VCLVFCGAEADAATIEKAPLYGIKVLDLSRSAKDSIGLISCLAANIVLNSFKCIQLIVLYRTSPQMSLTVNTKAHPMKLTTCACYWIGTLPIALPVNIIARLHL